jgi:hypothetical protein
MNKKAISSWTRMALDERMSGPPRCQAAFTTLFDFRQLVHTVMRTVRPPTFARTF